MAGGALDAPGAPLPVHHTGLAEPQRRAHPGARRALQVTGARAALPAAHAAALWTPAAHRVGRARGLGVVAGTHGAPGGRPAGGRHHGVRQGVGQKGAGDGALVAAEDEQSVAVEQGGGGAEQAQWQRVAGRWAETVSSVHRYPA